MIDYRNEQWRAIDDFYEVSNFGHVARIRGRLLHRRMNDFGYFVVRLCSPRRIEEVHRLVALAFVPNPMHCRQQSTSMATRRTTARSILNGAASSPRFLLARSVQNADFQN